MKFDEQARRALTAELASDRSGLWQDAVCEVHRFGEEAPVFLLLTNRSAIGAAFQQISALLKRWIVRFHETQFTVAFETNAGGDYMTLDFVTSDELALGSTDRKLGEAPIRGAPADSIFAQVRGRI